ncbi:S-layer homology domain-containing protein [Paenibacillus sp. UNC451MF]|uniref:S-layer homology domain-containing protein n=1 Tax=Paenibacillus sp. UNC451MF TaxID=1449063 RepID=UPI000490C82E|nr:S-layer homology domain-containing protein [Paenibacillus sp. UNC451MF]
MKKIIVFILMFMFLAVSHLQEAFADAAQPEIIVNKQTGEVTIAGIASAKGQTINLLVENPSHSVEYISDMKSDEGGNYRFTFTLLKSIPGIYKVELGGALSVTTQFTFAKEKASPNWSAGSTISASGIGLDRVTLTWTPATDDKSIRNYTIYSGGSEIATIPGNVTSYQVTDLYPYTSYIFKVEAADDEDSRTNDGPSVQVRTLGRGSGGSGGGGSSNTGSGSGSGSIEPGSSNGDTLSVKTEFNDADNSAVVKVGAEAIAQFLASTKPDANGVRIVTIPVSSKQGLVRAGVELPASVLKESRNTRFIVQTLFGDAEIRGDMMLNRSDVPADASIGIYLSNADKAQGSGIVQSRLVIELIVTVNGSAISWSNKEAPIKLRLRYTPNEEEAKQSEHITVLDVGKVSGEPLSVPSARFAASSKSGEAGTISFNATSSSRFAVTLVFKTFTDLTSYPWAVKPIEILTAKGIIQGTSEHTFEPGVRIKRADFVVLLVRALGLSAQPKTAFTDVNKSDYYYESVGIARELGITDGTGDNRFDPNAYITRQDMMTLTARAMSEQQISATAVGRSDLSHFMDEDKVASYAVDAIAAMVKEGVIEGDGQQLYPLQFASRAETAVMMYRIYNMQP